MEIKSMDSYTACSIIEGFCGYETTEHDIISAWSHLITTGDCWKLQGFYGRNASALIECGLFDATGEPSLECIDAFYDYESMGAAAGRDLLDEM
jgi:hypothetical protein